MVLRVVAFGTYDVRRHPRVAVIVEGLRALGDEVVDVNVPLGLTTAERVAMLQRPWLLGKLAGRLIATWWRIGREGWRVAQAGNVDAVVVGYLGHLDVLLAKAVFRGIPVVLDFLISGADTARDRGVTDGPRLRLLSGLDHLAVRSADVVVVDTPESTALVSERYKEKVVVTPVGAGENWYRTRSHREDHPYRPLRVVFFGLFTPLQGASFIGEALGRLAENPDIRATMIGNGQDLEVARARAAKNERVDWRDWVESDRLPAVVADHDVCLGIFGVTPKAARVVPNKVYQGAAAGCAIVTSDTAPQRRALGEAAVFVPAGDPEALAEALSDLASGLDRLRRLQEAARRRSEETFAPAVVVDGLRAALLGHSARVLP